MQQVWPSEFESSILSVGLFRAIHKNTQKIPRKIRYSYHVVRTYDSAPGGKYIIPGVCHKWARTITNAYTRNVAIDARIDTYRVRNWSYLLNFADDARRKQRSSARRNPTGAFQQRVWPEVTKNGYFRVQSSEVSFTLPGPAQGRTSNKKQGL